MSIQPTRISPIHRIATNICISIEALWIAEVVAPTIRVRLREPSAHGVTSRHRILLAIAVMYHGVPRVMLPDPAHAFGLYMSTSLMLLLSTGLLELVVASLMGGKFAKLERLISSIAARLPS